MSKLLQFISKSVEKYKVLWLIICAILLAVTLMDSIPTFIRVCSGTLLFVLLLILGSNVC